MLINTNENVLEHDLQRKKDLLGQHATKKATLSFFFSPIQSRLELISTSHVLTCPGRSCMDAVKGRYIGKCN